MFPRWSPSWSIKGGEDSRTGVNLRQAHGRSRSGPCIKSNEESHYKPMHTLHDRPPFLAGLPQLLPSTPDTWRIIIRRASDMCEIACDRMVIQSGDTRNDITELIIPEVVGGNHPLCMRACGGERSDRAMNVGPGGPRGNTKKPNSVALQWERKSFAISTSSNARTSTGVITRTVYPRRGRKEPPSRECVPPRGRIGSRHCHRGLFFCGDPWPYPLTLSSHGD